METDVRQFERLSSEGSRERPKEEQPAAPLRGSQRWNDWPIGDTAGYTPDHPCHGPFPTD